MDAATRAAGALLGINEATSEKPHLTAEAVAGIEDMRAPATTKVEYLLTAAGVKPASWLSIQTPDHMDTPKNQTPPVMPDELVQEHLKVARDAGLSVVVGETGTMGRRGDKHATTVDLLVGSSPENVKRLQEAAGRHDEHAAGLALGYPETAVDAYTRRRGEAIYGHQLTGTTPAVKSYASFVFSRDNLQEELKTPALWEATVRQTSPKIYAQYAAHLAWVSGRGPNPYED